MRGAGPWFLAPLVIASGLVGAFALHRMVDGLDPATGTVVLSVAVGVGAILLASSLVVLGIGYVVAYFSFLDAVRDLVRPRD